MVDVSALRQEFEAAQDRFEQYRASVSTAIEERPAGELSRALDVILPDLVFYEGQACAAGVGLAVLAAGGDNDDDNDGNANSRHNDPAPAGIRPAGITPADIARALTHGLVEQQAARRGGDFLAGFAAILARVNQELPESF